MIWTDKPQVSMQFRLNTTNAESILDVEEQESVMMFENTSTHFLMAMREIRQRR